MPKYALEIEYIGLNFSGSQRQSQRDTTEWIRTVQAELEEALSTLTRSQIKTIFSGRTDAGVSAKAQVVHFNYDKSLVASKFIHSLNAILPHDISVRRLEPQNDDFHALLDAKYKWYRYSITNRKERSAFDNLTLLEVQPLSLENINCMLQILIGEHDFSSFKNVGTITPSNICQIFYAKAQKRGDEILIDIVGNRFLYNMIRIIVGTVLMLEKKALLTDEAKVRMKRILDSQNRTNAGLTISPKGLMLMKVSYDEWSDSFIKNIETH